METIDEALARLGQLQEARAQLEPVWLEVEEKQGQAIAARKRLADDTKAFKKLPDPERLGAWPDLLKAYQAEVDALSKRSKLSELAFSDLLTALKSAPEAADVRKALKSQLSEQSNAKGSSQLDDRLRQKELQVTKLTSEVNDLEEELQSVKNQDVAVRRLQQQVKDMDIATEEAVMEAREEKDAEWSTRLEELRQELSLHREQQLDATAQLAEQREAREDELARLRQQRLEELQQAEQAVLARTVEVDTLSAELERVQAELEAERVLLREGARPCGSDSAGSVKVLQSLLDGTQQRAAGLEREAGDLRRILSEAEARAHNAEAQHGAEIARVTAELSEKQVEAQSLQEQLGLRPSFDEVALLRRQLANVEAVASTDVNAASSDLERRSLQRQRELEEQLSEARLRADSAAREAEALQSRLDAGQDEIGDLQHLVQRLETELAEASGKAPATSREPLGGLLPDGSCSSSAEAGSLSNVAAENAAMPSMMDIVSGQRDRLRERVGKLEQERDRWKTSAEDERKRAEQLHGDNVKLLERTRYLQSYQPKQGAGGRRPKLDQDLEGRYGGSEEGLGPSPFEQFQKDEKSRKIKAMNIGERLLVMLSAILMASKPARIVWLVYSSAMHLLVFLVLWRLAYTANHHKCLH